MAVTSRFRSQQGLTLIEVMVAAAVMMVGLLAVAGLVDGANKTTVTSRERHTATNLTRELIEAARGLPYAAVTGSATLTAIGAADPQLADTQAGTPHTIVRNNVVYTITTDVCIMDDARDGGGSHAGGSFCADSAAETALHPISGRSDRVPEDYKRVRVRTTWKTRGPQRTVQQTTLVNNPGSAGAPAVDSLTAPALGSPPAQVVAATSITFAVGTSSVPAQVKWLLDGAGQGLATGSARSWAFAWNLGAVGTAGAYEDGSYLVSAEAFDTYGVSGASRSLTIILNRSVPRAPAGVAGGRNNDVVEIEWLPNPERDLAGYQVFRVDASGEVLVPACGLRFATSCVDSSTSSGGDKVYLIRSYDRDPSGALRLGGQTALTVVSNNTPPRPPENACVQFESDLSAATLSWTKPSPVEDVDTGDSIAFYRIYRGGNTRANRYTKVSAAGTTHSFKDAINGSSYSYWLSSVDTRYGESNIVAVPSC